MAVYNEIQAPRYARMLQKLFGIKGAVPAKALAGDVSSSWVFFNGAENRYLEEWTSAAAMQVVAAVAANIGGFRLFNPLGSGVVGVITSILFTSTGGADVPQLTWQGGGGAASPVGPFAGGATPQVVSLDVRTGSNNANTAARTSLQTSSKNNNNTVFGTKIRQTSVASAVPFEFISNFEGNELILAPDTAYDVYSSTANNQIVVSMQWRERPLEEAERR